MKFVLCYCDAQAQVSSNIEVRDRRTSETLREEEIGKITAEKSEVKLMKNEEERSQKVISTYLYFCRFCYFQFSPSSLKLRKRRRK